MREDKTIKISVEQYKEMLTAYASVKALERYTKMAECYVSREKIAAICGFELKEDDKNADM